MLNPFTFIVVNGRAFIALPFSLAITDAPYHVMFSLPVKVIRHFVEIPLHLPNNYIQDKNRLEDQGHDGYLFNETACIILMLEAMVPAIDSYLPASDQKVSQF